MKSQLPNIAVYERECMEFAFKRLKQEGGLSTEIATKSKVFHRRYRCFRAVIRYQRRSKPSTAERVEPNLYSFYSIYFIFCKPVKLFNFSKHPLISD